MAGSNYQSNDSPHTAERWTGVILRLGVWISASLMIAGLLVAALVPSSVVPLSANPSLSEVMNHLVSSSFDPVTLMFAGLIMLMLTPVLRVITAVFGFAREHDWRFVVVSIIVLLMLGGEILYSILLKG
ncbi:MAG: DUF1634 domain-containing protein [Ignavibacteriae bacterium]|nr:MAG: DUF1634 domain-containing protein [Ignavibacteriota bacterium]